MPERTEDAALRGVLTLTLGGEEVGLRTLTLDESDEWLDLLAQHLSDIELPSTDGTVAIKGALTAPAASAAVLLAAYDRDATLGGLEAIRAKASKRELKTALELMVSAEDPFGEGVALSVAEAYGAPSRLLAHVLTMVLDEAKWPSQAASMTGASSATASDTRRSASGGRGSSSSSGGPTPIRQKRSG